MTLIPESDYEDYEYLGLNDLPAFDDDCCDEGVPGWDGNYCAQCA